MVALALRVFGYRIREFGHETHPFVLPNGKVPAPVRSKATRTGLEPATSGSTVRGSNQLIHFVRHETNTHDCILSDRLFFRFVARDDAFVQSHEHDAVGHRRVLCRGIRIPVSEGHGDQQVTLAWSARSQTSAESRGQARFGGREQRHRLAIRRLRPGITGTKSPRGIVSFPTGGCLLQCSRRSANSGLDEPSQLSSRFRPGYDGSLLGPDVR